MIESLVKAYEALTVGLGSHPGQIALAALVVIALARLLQKEHRKSLEGSERRESDSTKRLEEAKKIERESAAALLRNHESRLEAMERERKSMQTRMDEQAAQCQEDRVAAATSAVAMNNQIAGLRLALVKCNILPAASFGPELLDGYTERPAEKPRKPRTLRLPK